MNRSPLQRAQAKRINPYVGRPKAITVSSSAGPSFWVGLDRQQLSDAVKQREAQRQESRPLYPNREDMA